MTSVSATATATAAAGSFFAGPGDVHSEVASVEVRSVHGVHGLFRFLIAAHGDEGKSARATAGAIHHEVGLEDRAVCGESVLEIIFRRIEGKVSDKQFVIHVL